MVSRRAQHIAELLDLKVCEARASFEAAHSLALSLEQVCEEEHDLLDLYSWSKYQDLAAKVQRQRDAFRTAIGDKAPFPGLPGTPSKALAGIQQCDDGRTRLRQKRRPVMAGERKEAVSKAGEGSADRATGRSSLPLPLCSPPHLGRHRHRRTR